MLKMESMQLNKIGYNQGSFPRSLRVIGALLALVAAPIAGQGRSVSDWQPADAPLITEWGEEVTPENAWTEYPRPQLVRDNWTCLNGLWEYTITDKAAIPGNWNGEILVPFPVEAPLSGVARNLEPEEFLWYKRQIEVKTEGNERVLLHFGAVDYSASVFLNGVRVGDHKGGYTPFTMDITEYLEDQNNELLVKVRDATGEYQLKGKQSLEPRGIWYNRCSGIWQTVWLESVPVRRIEDVTYASDLENGTIMVACEATGPEADGEKVKVTLYDGDTKVAEAEGESPVELKLDEPRPWSPTDPHLYDVTVALLESEGDSLDTVKSYVGMRTIGEERDRAGKLRFTLNGKPLFLYGPLDQGWWPGGLLTPPSDEASLWELKYLKESGFNMVRKHVKVEPSRYYYHCDRLGIIVWQDHVNAGEGGRLKPRSVSPEWIRLGTGAEDAVWPQPAHEQWVAEYGEMVDLLEAHPCIGIWTAFNEAWGQHRSREVVRMATEEDSSRLVCLASGGNFWEGGDVVAQHDYPGPSFPLKDDRFTDYVKMVGEMGGYAYPMEGHTWHEGNNWGYGMKSRNLHELKHRYSKAFHGLLSLRRHGVSGGVYTQTSDVFSEINGLLTFDRIPKLDAGWLSEINAPITREGLRGSRSRSERGRRRPDSNRTGTGGARSE